jgi:hypothetical protein
MGKSAVNMGVCPITILVVGAVTAYHFVGTDLALAGAGDNTFGVAAYDGTDEATTVDTLGVVPVEAGAAVAAGALLQSDASGRAITKDAGATVARAIDAATAAGDLIRCVLIPN